MFWWICVLCRDVWRRVLLEWALLTLTTEPVHSPRLTLFLFTSVSVFVCLLAYACEQQHAELFISLCVIANCQYTVNHKKRDIVFLTITLANLNRFL